MDESHFGDIKKIVDDAEWQELRRSFLGTWKVVPALNILTLRNYLDDMSDPLKVRRVLNYLTGSAFRIGIIQAPEIEKLLSEVRVVWEIKMQNNCLTLY